jgi:hypothetical protein
MSTRYDLPPVPNLADYAFGEKLGAGSYGKEFLITILFHFRVIAFRNCI